MADVKISALNALGAAPAADDLLPVVDVSGVETKKLRIDELFTNPNVTGTVTADGLTVDGDATIQGSGGQSLVLRNTNTGIADGESFGTIDFYSDDASTGANGIRAQIEANQISTFGASELTFKTAGSSSTTLFNRLKIDNVGDISFYEDTGTTAKFFWDASAESLGIGNTVAGTLNAASAVSDLAVGDGSGTAGVTVYSGSASYGALCFADGTVSTSAYQAYLKFDHSNNALSYVQNNTERLRIDSSGNVGIGTTSPVDTGAGYGDLTINGSVGAFISLQSNGSTTGVLQTIGTETRLSTSVASGYLTFRTDTGGAGTEAARIDSSGNLLVGQSSTTVPGAGNTTLGLALRADGGALFSRAGGVNATAFFNKNTDDGAIVDFRKDGTAVGSILSSNGDLVIGSTDHGVKFHDSLNAILPWIPSSNSADTSNLDIGSSLYKFKDLYLSSGVYLGGTGAANHLDDYEEGNWTPTLVGNTTAGTYDITPTSTSYTKIGNLVTVRGRLTITVTSAGSGLAKFGGLPFFVAGSNPANGTVRSSGVAFPSGVSYLTTGIWTSNSSDFAIIGVADNAGTTTLDVSSISTGDYIEFTLVYVTS